MSKTSEKQQNLGIHILCCLGTMLLLGLQYLQYIGLAEISVTSWPDALPLAARWLCLSGAMLLAGCLGYSLYEQKCTASYFTMLLRLLYTYILCSICGIVMSRFILERELDMHSIIQSFFAFSVTGMSRIAAMYLALALASPFLNAAFQGLRSSRARLGFFLIAAALSTLQPILRLGGLDFIPVWCKGLFPVAAYLGGSYIRRYSQKKEAPLMLLLLLLTVTGQSLLVYFFSRSHGSMFCPWLDSMAALPCLCIAMSLLSLFHSRKPKDSAATRFFTGASGGALAALLLGTPLIECLVPAFEETFQGFPRRLWAGFGVVPTIFFLCCALGLLLQLPCYLLERAFAAKAPQKKKPAKKKKPVQKKLPAPEKREELPRNTVPEIPEEPALEEMPQPENTYIPRHAMDSVPQAPEEIPISRAPREYSVDAILEEQGISAGHPEDPVDALIFSLTAGENPENTERR